MVLPGAGPGVLVPQGSLSDRHGFQMQRPVPSSTCLCTYQPNLEDGDRDNSHLPRLLEDGMRMQRELRSAQCQVHTEYKWASRFQDSLGSSLRRPQALHLPELGEPHVQPLEPRGGRHPPPPPLIQQVEGNGLRC